MNLSTTLAVTVLLVAFTAVLSRRDSSDSLQTARTGRTKSERKGVPGQRGSKRGCGAVKQAWGQQRFGNVQVPGSMIDDGVKALRVCTPKTNRTCCTSEMEEKLVSRSRRDYDKITSEKLNQLKTKFTNQANRFRAFCLDLISNSSRDLHEMFTKTYGIIYEQHSAVFTALFSDFHRYYRGTDLSLTGALDKFFQTLLQRVFLLLNAHYTFDDSYMNCVARHAEQLQPFGDVPRKLSVHLNRAFVAARTFLQGLITGANIAAAASRIEPNVECGKAITRMLYCPYCSGLVSVTPCRTYCNNVMRGCLVHHAQLAEAWTSYIEAMEQLSGRLETSFSMESVLDPLEVKISDAIMNVQENSEAVTSKIFQLCGQPTLGSRTRRDIINDVSVFQLRYRRQSRDHQGGGGILYAPPTVAPQFSGSPLSRAVQETRQVLLDSTNFWQSLPDDACHTVSPSKTDTSCWTGQTKGRYEVALIGVGLANQTDNREVVVDISHKDQVVNNLIQRLKQITSKLRQAHSGQDVNWMIDGDEDQRKRGRDDDEGDDDDDEMSGFMMPEEYRPRSQNNHKQNRHQDMMDDTNFAPFTPPWMAATRPHYAHEGREGIGWRSYDVTLPSANHRHVTPHVRYIDPYYYSNSRSYMRCSLTIYIYLVTVTCLSVNYPRFWSS